MLLHTTVLDSYLAPLFELFKLGADKNQNKHGGKAFTFHEIWKRFKLLKKVWFNKEICMKSEYKSYLTIINWFDDFFFLISIHHISQKMSRSQPHQITVTETETQCTKMGRKYPKSVCKKCHKIYLPILSAQAQKFGISMKNGFIGCP